MPRPVIEIENLKKEYRLGSIGGKTFRKNVDELIRNRKGDDRKFMALDGVDLSVDQGEALGIVGSNGAGKASFGDMLRLKEFEHKLQREGVEDARWAASNALQQQNTGATLASTAANVANTNAKMDADEFSQLFRKRDADNKDVADTESISRARKRYREAENKRRQG